VFIFDMNTPHGLATRWGTKDTVTTTGAGLVELNQHRYDAVRRTNTTTTTIFAPVGEPDLYHRSTEVHRQRGYPTGDILQALEIAGFTMLSVEGLADGFHGLARGLAPLNEDMGRVMVVALKGSTERPLAILEAEAARVE
jgi:hypothetical protein